ncbi:unnamed protein product [Cylindrotheca closterium]|uniref:Uncharacterized protein n=1 Tax=Cylindrotheca closterium TaxID=2856 RepID=A0AAD2JP68_9STRA|nr:unnamed protein product [Cylindrotheca closterium]
MKNQQSNRSTIPQSLLELNASRMLSSDSVVLLADSSAENKSDSTRSCLEKDRIIGILDEVLDILEDGFLDDFQETTSRNDFHRTTKDTIPNPDNRRQH